MHHVARRVGEDLHLDVPGADHRLLEEDGGVAECRLGLAHAGLERLAQVLPALDATHAAAPAPGDGLGEDREPDAFCRGHEHVDVGARSALRSVGRPAFLAAPRLRALLPVRCSTLAGGPTKVIPWAGALGSEVGVLGEEAVAGVDGVRAASTAVRTTPAGSR